MLRYFVWTEYEFSESCCRDTEAKHKQHDLAEETSKVKGKWNEDKIKRLDFINHCVKRMKQKHTSAMLMKQWLGTIECLQNELHAYLLNLSIISP